MIARSDLLALAYYKKAVFTGSDKNMCYRLERMEEDGVEKFRATVWEGPYNYASTPEEKKVCHFEDFTEEGITAAAEWMNGQRKNYPS